MMSKKTVTIKFDLTNDDIKANVKVKNASKFETLYAVCSFAQILLKELAEIDFYIAKSFCNSYVECLTDILNNGESDGTLN